MEEEGSEELSDSNQNLPEKSGQEIKEELKRNGSSIAAAAGILVGEQW